MGSFTLKRRFCGHAATSNPGSERRPGLADPATGMPTNNHSAASTAPTWFFIQSPHYRPVPCRVEAGRPARVAVVAGSSQVWIEAVRANDAAGPTGRTVLE